MRLEMAGIRGGAGALIEGIAMDPRGVPGTRVRHPTEPDWGVGHVQSVGGDRITVNFERIVADSQIPSRASKELAIDLVSQLDEWRHVFRSRHNGQ